MGRSEVALASGGLEGGGYRARHIVTVTTTIVTKARPTIHSMPRLPAKELLFSSQDDSTMAGKV